MKSIVLLLALVLISDLGNAQTRRFRNELQRILLLEDTIHTINPTLDKGDGNVDLLNVEDLIDNNVLSYCQKYTHKNEICESKTLKQMSRATQKFFKANNFYDKKRYRRLNREVKRLKRAIITNFGIIEIYSFSLPIYDDNKGRYFYDKKGPDGEPNLYKGNKNRIKRNMNEDDDFPYESLDGLTTEEINTLIVRRLSKLKIASKLKKSLYTYVGVDVRIDPRTINKNKIPHARVVLYLGARRLQGVKLRKVS